MLWPSSRHLCRCEIGMNGSDDFCFACCAGSKVSSLFVTPTASEMSIHPVSHTCVPRSCVSTLWPRSIHASGTDLLVRGYSNFAGTGSATRCLYHTTFPPSLSCCTPGCLPWPEPCLSLFTQQVSVISLSSDNEIASSALLSDLLLQLSFDVLPSASCCPAVHAPPTACIPSWDRKTVPM